MRLRVIWADSQLREAIHRETCAVAFERPVELGQHGVAVIGILHVDEVDDDDAAEIAQAELPRDDLRCFEIGLENRLVETAATDKSASIDIDGRHGLGLVEYQVTARLEVHAARQRLLDFVLDTVEIEQRPLAEVMRNAVGNVLRVLRREFMHFLIRLARIDLDARGLLRDHVAQDALREVEILVDQRRWGSSPIFR